MAEQKLLRDIAHDLRTPLSIIQLTAESMQMGAKDQQTKNDLDVILKQITRITELADELSAQRE